MVVVINEGNKKGLQKILNNENFEGCVCMMYSESKVSFVETFFSESLLSSLTFQEIFSSNWVRHPHTKTPLQ